MTTIEIDLRDPAADGTDLPAVGTTEWTPTRRRHIDESDDYIVLPVGFVVSLDGPTRVTVDPTGADWAWRVRERVPGGITRFVQVPDSVAVLEYADLVDVDPASLDPDAEPEAAWWLALADITTPTPGLTKGEADGYYAPRATTPNKTYVDSADSALSTRVGLLEARSVATRDDIPGGAPVGSLWVVGP